MLIKLILLCSIFGTSVLATVEFQYGTINGTFDGKEYKGEYKYYWDSAYSSCGTVYFLGVGTSMTVNDYDTVASRIVSGFDIVTIVSDHNPGTLNIVKTSDTKYAWFYNTMVKSLQEIVRPCNQTEDVCSETNGPRYIVGGHSASGEAAINAINKMNPSPHGFLGLDPFEVDQKMSIPDSIPTLVWGFGNTTCFVTISSAAKEAYNISSETHRIFYRIDNPDHTVEHCVFTDDGCPGCPRGTRHVDDMYYDEIYNAVAHSTHSFVDAMTRGVFNKIQFVLPPLTYPGEHYDLFVNEDDV